MKKTSSIIVLIIACLVFVTACGSTKSTSDSTPAGGSKDASNEKPITMKLGHVGAVNSNADLPAKHFAELVNKKTNGLIKIEIFPAGQLGGDRDMLENIQNGSLELGWIAMGNYGTLTPAFDGFVMPFLIDDADKAYKVYKSEVAGKALKSLEKFGITGLGIAPAGFQQFGTNKKPIKNPEDLKGQKIRAPQSPIHIEALKQLGADVTPIPFAELYSALQTHVIDGTEVPTPAWVANKFYEVTKSVSITNSYPWPYVITMSSAVFNKLSDAQKQAMREAGQETLDYAHPLLKQMEKDAVDQLKKLNVTVVEDVDQAAFRNLMEPIYKKSGDKDPLIKETIEAIKQIK